MPTSSSSNGYLVLLIILGLVILFNLYAQIIILLAKKLNNREKLVSSLMHWILPIVWFLFTRSNYRNTKLETMTKTKREELRKKGNFYESGTGMYGPGGPMP